jgi:hypothetical protein
MNEACSTNGREEKCTQHFGQQIWKEKQASMGENVQIYVNEVGCVDLIHLASN